MIMRTKTNDPLVGLWFFTDGTEEKDIIHGRVLTRIDPEHYLCQLNSWSIDNIEANTWKPSKMLICKRLVPIEQMQKLKFYDTYEKLKEHFKRGEVMTI